MGHYPEHIGHIQSFKSSEHIVFAVYRYYQPYGGKGEQYRMYSACGTGCPWHLNATKAWEDKKTCQCKEELQS